jgi:ribosomal protein S6 kinase beta
MPEWAAGTENSPIQAQNEIEDIVAEQGRGPRASAAALAVRSRDKNPHQVKNRLIDVQLMRHEGMAQTKKVPERPSFFSNIDANELLTLFRCQKLEASGDAYFKQSVMKQRHRYFVELRGATLVMFRNSQVACSSSLLMRDIIGVMVLKHFKVTVEKKQGQSPKIHINGPGLSNGQTLYIKAVSEPQLAIWRHALAIAESIQLPGLMSLTIESIIGQGGGGKVFLVYHEEDMSYYALKVIDKNHTFTSVNALRHVVSERNLMEMVGHHPFVLPMKFAFQTDFNLFIGTTFCAGGDLATYLKNQCKKHGKTCPEASFDQKNGAVTTEMETGGKPTRRYGGHLSEEQTRSIAAEVLLALEHLHTRGIVYRDLKPENIFIDGTGHIRLGDYGLAKNLQVSRTGNGFVRTSSICGTRNYLPPEMLFGRLYSFEVDMWSFGVMLFRMLCGRFPFEATQTKDVFHKVKREKVRAPRHLSPVAKSLLEGLLCRDQHKRLNVGAAKRHDFFKAVEWPSVLNKISEPPIHDIELGTSSLDALENFELSKLHGISIGEYIPDEAECLHIIRVDPQARMDVEGRIIGFEYATIDDDTPTPPPLEVRRISGFLESLTSSDSNTTGGTTFVKKLSADVGVLVKAAFSPRAVRQSSRASASKLPDRADDYDAAHTFS